MSVLSTVQQQAGSGGLFARPARIASLDAGRGLMLVASVGTEAVLDPRPEQLVHAAWIGLTAYDLIFPTFVVLSGCGLAFAYARHVSLTTTLRRTGMLLLAGLAYSAAVAHSSDLSQLRWTGPLQLYAALVLLLAALHVVVRGPAAWAGVTATAAGVHAVFLLRWQSSCGGVLTPDCNPSRTIDLAWLGAAHSYRQGALGHDPEGLVVLAGALVSACVGVTAGHLLLRARTRQRAGLPPQAWLCAAWAAAVGLAAAGLSQVLPVAKRLWTSPFALGAAALAVLLLAVVHAVLADRRTSTAASGRARDRVAGPLVALGRNSLLVYFGSHLLQDQLAYRGRAEPWADAIAVLGHPRITWVIASVAAWTALAVVLDRRRIYLRP